MASLLSALRTPLLTPVENDDYREWRIQLTRTRLRVGFWLGIVGNPTYVALDFLLYPSIAGHFLVVRIIMELALVAGLLLTYTRPTETRQSVQFLVFVWSICFLVAYMTTAIGGFRSTYYAGMTLLIFSSAVLVPLRWRLHVVSQAGVLAFYYAINILTQPGSGDLFQAMETSYFIVWTCIVSTASVILYERVLRDEFSARRQLEESNHKLLELDRLKTQFFANVSHELRTPLTLIIGAFRRLMSGGLAANTLEMVRAGLRNAVHLLYLINELLDLSRFESGRMRRQKQPVDFALIVRQIGSNFEHSVRQRIHLRGLNKALVVVGERKLLKKLVYNLLSNAVKFSDSDSGEIWIRMRDTPDSAILEIEDNGIGIPEGNLHQIFDRFTQVEDSTTRRFEGTGIGLALVKEIVAAHEGTIEVDSRVGEGSTFTVTLPRSSLPASELADEDEDVFPTPQEHVDEDAQRPNLAYTGELILVADDNRDMRQYLEDVLEPHFRVVLACDGGEALELAKAHKPALVLTDIMMPVASGHDLLANMRNEEGLREIPVVFLTALSASESRLTALEAGVDDLIMKPFEESELIARLRNVLEARRQQRETARLRIEGLRRFLPAPVANVLIEQGSEEALASHRAEVTTVFFDLRGFTAFAEDAEPEELMTMLGGYQAQIGALIDEYGGTLERFSGDAIMVFFNDPLPTPDHQLRAIRLATAARAALPDFEMQWRNLGFQLGIGIGVATGYATIGMIGYERRKDYGVIGPVTNLAARLCARAESGQILIPERLANMVSDIATLAPVGHLQLHGIRAPVNAFNVIEINAGH